MLGLLKFHRLEQGYFFIGNNNYMQISFWDGGDSYEKIHNISWGVENKGLCFIEISAKDNTDRANYLNELINILQEKTSIIYNPLRKGKWRYEYPNDIFYLDALQSFIDNEKPIIDEYIGEHPQSGIHLLDKNYNDKYVLKQLHEKAKTTEKKKEGVVSVAPSAYLMSLHHNELQNALVDYLKTDSNIISVDSEINNVDIAVKTVAGEKIFYELKTSDVRIALRLAIGQLLEYCHYSNKTKADKMIIVTKYAPSNDDIIYIKRLRTLYKIPIYYQQFDIDKKQLSGLY
jgi:hypothetical protein